MNGTTVSVIIPVYNLEDCLAQTLDSVISQTHKNLEIILVDDGSRDNSLSVIEEYAERDPRIKVVKKENGGVSSARNAGLDVATGEYAGFVDGDDVLEPDMYEYLMDGAVRYRADVVQCGVIKDGERLFAPKTDVVIQSRQKLFNKADALLAGGVWCKLYRRECVRDVRFDTAYPIGEDVFYTLSALQSTECVAFLSESKYNYLTRQGSALNSKISEAKLTSYRRMLKRAMELFGRDDSARRYLTREMLRNDADMASKIVRSQDPDTAPLYDEIRKEVRKNTLTVLFGRGLNMKMRLKLLLLAYADGLYRRGVSKAHN